MLIVDLLNNELAADEGAELAGAALRTLAALLAGSDSARNRRVSPLTPPLVFVQGSWRIVPGKCYVPQGGARHGRQHAAGAAPIACRAQTHALRTAGCRPAVSTKAGPLSLQSRLAHAVDDDTQSKSDQTFGTKFGPVYAKDRLAHDVAGNKGSRSRDWDETQSR